MDARAPQAAELSDPYPNFKANANGPLIGPLGAFSDHADATCVVELNLCSGYYYLYYGSKVGRNPFRDSAAAYLKNYRRSDAMDSLSYFYESFKPANLAEGLFGSSDDYLYPLTEMSPFTRFQPWRESIIQMSGWKNRGNQNFGPVTREKLERETTRIIECCESFESIGYAPEKFEDGYIRGYFLLDGKSHRFLINAGVHRASILSAMGAASIEVKFHPTMPRFITYDSMRFWPQVNRGRCGVPLAETMFRAHFN